MFKTGLSSAVAKLMTLATNMSDMMKAVRYQTNRNVSAKQI
jgi:hypothetical protein